MKVISWNVNGINACFRKGLADFMKKENADFYCFQEVKAQQDKLPDLNLKYKEFHSFAKRRGYSGVSIFSKNEPISVIDGLGDSTFDDEGRTLTLEFEKYFLINAYFPYANREFKRLDFKINFNKAFLKFCNKLNKKKPVIIASDFNVAHKDIDLKNFKQNFGNPGFTIEEREWFDSLLDAGYIDTFREFVKEGEHYTWWSYAHEAREKNIGWRIDYMVISEILKNRLIDSKILPHVRGSDHCPIVLELEC